MALGISLSLSCPPHQQSKSEISDKDKQYLKPPNWRIRSNSTLFRDQEAKPEFWKRNQVGRWWEHRGGWKKKKKSRELRRRLRRWQGLSSPCCQVITTPPQQPSSRLIRIGSSVLSDHLLPNRNLSFLLSWRCIIIFCVWPQLCLSIIFIYILSTPHTFLGSPTHFFFILWEQKKNNFTLLSIVKTVGLWMIIF